jgi:hypothetical protein
MQVNLPALWAMNVRHAGMGTIRQLLLDVSESNCRVTAYTIEKDTGHLLTGDNGEVFAYLSPKRPRTTDFQLGSRVLVAKYDSLEEERLDLRHGTWLRHPQLDGSPQVPTQFTAAAKQSWRGAFHFTEEDSAR